MLMEGDLRSTIRQGRRPLPSVIVLYKGDCHFVNKGGAGRVPQGCFAKTMRQRRPSVYGSARSALGSTTHTCPPTPLLGRCTVVGSARGEHCQTELSSGEKECIYYSHFSINDFSRTHTREIPTCRMSDLWIWYISLRLKINWDLIYA